MCSYLRRREGGVYYTRMVVPARLRPIVGKTDLGRSLKTKDQTEAKRLLPGWLEWAQSELAAAERRLAKPPAPANDRDNWQSQMSVAMDLGLINEAEPDPEFADEPDPVAVARRELRVALENKVLLEQVQRTAPTAVTPTVTITGMFDGYAGQDGSKPETIRQWRSIINHLVAFLGHDDAKAVRLPDLARWREHLRTEAVKDGKPRSAKTINDSYLAAANAVFSYGVNQLLIPANPASDLAKVRAPKAPKLREKDFTKAERKIILQAALVAASGNLSPERALARRWVPWLCAYTGARVNEITQLRKTDVRQIEGIWTIHITPEAGGVKTNEARTVPIHEHLIAQGFLAAISDKPDGPLFYKPDPAATSPRGQHKQVGTFLAAWVRDLGVTDPAIRPNHAWRHTFKTICQEAEIEERAADYMQGHASKGQGRRYGANTVPALAAQLAKFPRFPVGEGE